MKKRTTILIASILALGALAAAPLVIAEPHGRGHGPAGMGAMHEFGILAHLQHAKDALGLSDQQVEQIKAIAEETHAANAGSREQFHDSLKDAAEILLANPNDIAGAQAVLDQQAAAERVLKSNLLNATAKAFAVLNADQRAKLRTMIEEHHGDRGR
jgi:Spy/CpxP family protein refolding chaperone